METILDIVVTSFVKQNLNSEQAKIAKNEILQHGISFLTQDLSQSEKRRKEKWMNISSLLKSKNIVRKNARYDDYVIAKLTLDTFDPNSVFMPGMKYDESHKKHTFAMYRAKSEHVSNSLVSYEVYFMVYLNYAISRKKLNKVKDYYQLLLSILHLTENDPFQLRIGKLFAVRLRYDIVSVLEILLSAIERTFQCEGLVMDGFKSEDIIREYAFALLPDPKGINNKLRTCTSWMVKKYGIFSEFINVNISDAYASLEKAMNTVHPINMKRVVNPNFKFANCKVNVNALNEYVNLYNEYGCPLLSRLCSMTLSSEVDMSDFNVVGFHAMLLSIAQMGGYGRAWKRSAAPEVLEDKKNDRLVNYFKEIIANVYKEAVQKSISKVPNTVESVNRYFFTQMRTTGSGQKKQFTIQQNGKQINLNSTKKPLVILSEGLNVVHVEKQKGKKEYFRTASRDVPIKASRLVYPIRVGTLLLQSFLVKQLMQVTSDSDGRLDVSRPLYSKIAVGPKETSGTRIIDDAWILNISGRASERFLQLGIDYSEYDAHMVYSIYRKPMMEAILEIAKNENMNYFGYTPEELVERAFGSGYVHETWWDAGRIIGYIREQDLQDVYDNDPIVNPVEGAYPITGTPRLSNDFDDDVFCYNGQGEDLLLLTSHGSGEVSTLLDNTEFNIAVSRYIMEDARVKKYVTAIRDKFVGDDSQMEIEVVDSNFGPDEFDDLMNAIVDAAAECNMVVNPSKVNLTYLSAEFRQTHAKCGILIPQDRIMIHSSENGKFIDDIQAFLMSYASLMMEKHSRGLKYELGMLQMYTMAMTLASTRIGRSRMLSDKIIYDDSDDLATRIHMLVSPIITHCASSHGGIGCCISNLGVRVDEDTMIKQTNDDHIQKIIKNLSYMFGEKGLLKNDFDLDEDVVKQLFDKSDKHFITQAFGTERLRKDTSDQIKLVTDIDVKQSIRRTFNAWIKSEPSLKVKSGRAVGEKRLQYMNYMYMRYINIIKNEQKRDKMYSKKMKYSYLYDEMAKVSVDVIYSRAEMVDWPDIYLDDIFKMQRRIFGVRDNARPPKRKPVDMRTIFSADPFISNIWRMDELARMVGDFKNSRKNYANLSVANLLNLIGFTSQDALRIENRLESTNTMDILTDPEIDGMLSDGFSSSLGVLNDTRTTGNIGSISTNINAYVNAVMQNRLYHFYSAISNNENIPSVHPFTHSGQLGKVNQVSGISVSPLNVEFTVDKASKSLLAKKIQTRYKVEGAGMLAGVWSKFSQV